MTLSLSKPTAGDVGWAAAINQNWTDIENQSNNQATGPASATDNAVVRFDGTSGKLVQNSAVTINDTLGQISWPTGGGAGTRVLGPSDQDLAIAAESAGASSAGRALSLAGGPGGATSGAGGAVSLQGGAAAGGNSAGGAVTIATGAGTGTGKAGLITEKVGGFTRRITSTPVTLSDGVATTILTISLSPGERVAGLVMVQIDITNGTDFQVLSRIFGFAAADKSGTLHSHCDFPSFFPGVATSGSVDAGVTLSVLDGSNQISLQLLVGTTLSGATLTCTYAVDVKHSNNSATFTVA